MPRLHPSRAPGNAGGACESPVRFRSTPCVRARHRVRAGSFCSTARLAENHHVVRVPAEGLDILPTSAHPRRPAALDCRTTSTLLPRSRQDTSNRANQDDDCCSPLQHRSYERDCFRPVSERPKNRRQILPRDCRTSPAVAFDLSQVSIRLERDNSLPASAP